MTQKRFVKLLMSQGYSRNTANAMARMAQARGKTYQQTYDAVTSFARLSKTLTDAVEPMTKAFKRMVRALSAGVEAFGDKVREELGRDRGV